MQRLWIDGFGPTRLGAPQRISTLSVAKGELMQTSKQVKSLDARGSLLSSGQWSGLGMVRLPYHMNRSLGVMHGNLVSW